MASGFETGFELKLGRQKGCVLWETRPFIVETVAEARAAILRHAMDALDRHAHDPKRREHLRLNVRRGRSTWNDLIECEEGRRYDPAHPDAGMTCSYLLYMEGNLEGVGGLIWTYGVQVWATGPPEVWDHPADQPIGLDTDDGGDNDLPPDRDGG